jgi:hypothetical protein
MSLFAILYAANPPTPEGAIGAAFPGQVVQAGSSPSRVQTDALEAVASRRPRPNFDLELLGFEPAVSIYFAIDKDHSVEARQQLAAAVRNFLLGTKGDVTVMYLDTLVLKRLAETAVCATSYSDLIPDDGRHWLIVPELPQPE